MVHIIKVEKVQVERNLRTKLFCRTARYNYVKTSASKMACKEYRKIKVNETQQMKHGNGRENR